MTAEIAIMNKVGVALAADSAVTITTPIGTKIFNTNKLFMLSKYNPVGIMVYGNAELMGIPWETIIKEYRRNLADTSFLTLSEYGDNFINFLSNHKSYFPEDKQNRHVSIVAQQIFASIAKQIDNLVKQVIGKKGKIEHTEFTGIVDNEIKGVNKFFTSLEKLDSFSDDDVEAIYKKYEKIISDEINNIFGSFPLTNEQKKSLLEIAIRNFTCNTFEAIRNYSGIVVSGFGSDEIYPSIVEFRIELVINDQLKFIKNDTDQINDNGQNAIVSPFAQAEMVSSFMEGIAPDYKNKLYTELQTVFSEFSKNFSDALIKNLVKDKSKAKSIEQNIQKANQDLLQKFIQSMQMFSMETNVSPILQSVGVLPIEELATMAESLVNLTSFKRRVTLDAETVGGPIDVAVISKGDGFVWIKRKHYFDAKYNPHFFNNYYLK